MNDVGELITAARAAVERRADTGWPAADTARDALSALSGDGSEPGAVLEQELARTAARFRLSELDRRLLAVVALAELVPAAHLLCGLLSGDPGPGRPTVALALELAGVHPADPEGRARFGELAPLVRCGLVELAGSEVLPARRLVLPRRVAAQLAGDDLPGPALLPLLADPVPVDLQAARMLAQALRAGEQLVWVHSVPGAAGTAIAAGACALLDVPCLLADLGRLPTLRLEPETADTGTSIDPAAVRQTVRELALEAGLTGSVLVLAGADRAAPALAELLSCAVPVVAVSRTGWDPAWPGELPVTIRAPRLTYAEREREWAAALGPDLPREVTALRLTPEDIVRVGRHALRQAELTGERVPGLDTIRQSVRGLGRVRHAGAVDPAAVTFADLVLPDHAESEVRRLLDWARYRDELLSLAPLQGKGGKGTGICALFSGGPGTGKTLAAHVVADTLGLDLMQVDLSTVVSKYIGETEKNLERIFAEAESLNAVLFFDEADSLFGSRSEVKDARDRYANQEIAYLLQRMEHFDGITVLATNLRGNLDPAFARRLQFIITFPDPDEPTRHRLWEHHLACLPRIDAADPVDSAGLAKALDLAGGDVRNIVLSAAYAGIAAGEPVGMRHLVDAAIREYAKLGRRIPEMLARRAPAP